MKQLLIWAIAAVLLVGLMSCNGETETEQDITTDGSSTDVAGDPSEDVASDGTTEPDGDLADVPTEPVEDLTPTAQFAIGGIENPVEVLIDDYGITHISCLTDADCMAALGYLHASRRMFQMDINRRAIHGTLSALFGNYFIETDTAYRQYFSTANGELLDEVIWAGLEPATQALYVAYAEGVNAWIEDMRAERNGARLSEEYYHSLVPSDIAQTIPEWIPQDSVAMWVSAMFGNGDIPPESWYALTAAAFPEALWFDLIVSRPVIDSYTFDALSSKSNGLPRSMLAESLRANRERLQPIRNALVDIHTHDRMMRRSLQRLGWPVGSNNWALSAAFTGGHAVIAGDPHGPFSNPAYAQAYIIDSVTRGEGTLHVSGINFAGDPLFIIGFNRHVSWGATVSYADTTDVYIETLTEDGQGVVFNGESVPFVEREDTIAIRGGLPLTVTHRWVPHHGPVLSIDEEHGLAFTRRWTGHAAPLDPQAYADLLLAENVEEAMDALTQAQALGVNVVLADDAGRVGWHVAARVPDRPWASPDLAPWLLLPGDGSAEWDGFIPLEDHPRLVDPTTGWVATANNAFSDAWLDGDPTNDDRPYLQALAAQGYRHGRIAELLERTRGEHTADDSIALQTDTYSVQAAGIVPGILDAATTGASELSARAAQLVSAMQEWEYTCPTGLDGIQPDSSKAEDAVESRESIGCTAYHTALIFICRTAFLDEFETYGDPDWFTVGGVEAALYRALAVPESLLSGEALWDDRTTAAVVETRQDVILKGLEDAAAFLVDTLSNDPDDWRWGRLHTITLQGFYIGPQWNVGPYANDGAMISVDPGYFSYEESQFAHVTGPVMRLVVEMDPAGPVGRYQLPGGLDAHHDSPYYDNLLPLWLRNEPVPLHFDHDEAVAQANEFVLLEPRE